jgi:hypothetical protein
MIAHSPARTFMLPVPLSRMLAACAAILETAAGRQHQWPLPVTNQIERLNGEIKRSTEVVGIIPQ